MMPNSDSATRSRWSVVLKPIDTTELLMLVTGWLSQPENYQWLEFVDGRPITPQWLKIMCQRKSDVVRVFTPGPDMAPIGVVGLTNIHFHFRTALLWVVVGDKSFRVRGYATGACAEVLTYGFDVLGLHAIHGWSVEGNPSIKIMERLGFTTIGRQRQCHVIDGRAYDRICMDILSTEHQRW